MTSSKGDALVVGGGVIGTTSAFRLAREGWRVTLFDADAGSGATWAAAGMIAPSAEIAPGERENFTLQRRALDSWHEVAQEVGAITGEAIELFATGTLLVGLDASDRRLVDQHASVAASFGLTPKRVTRVNDIAYFDAVTARITEGLFLEGDGWLDPDHVIGALSKANEALGVRIVAQMALRATTKDANVEVTTSSETYRGDIGVLATGAFPLPEGVSARVANAVRPVRGMTVRVRGVDRSSAPTLRAFVRGRSLYMVSRPGGYCVLGGSSDEQQELVVELGELQRLLRDALDVVPALDNAAVLETRQGLRPASTNLLPFVEVVDDRWVWLSGHYRHGVTLAPLVAADALCFARSLT